MGDANVMFGFEILQSLYDNQVTKKEDVLILFVHWYLIKNSFRCVGFGDSKAYNASEKGSELLPEGWNTHPNYALRYVKDEKLYILHGIKSDEDLLLNLLRTDNQNVTNIEFPINQTVTSLHGSLETVMPTYQTVLQIVQTDLLNPVFSGNTAETSTQTSTESRDHSAPIRTDPLRVGQPARSLPSQPWDPLVDPANVGRADLDPFARGGGGGMIYDPFPPLRNPVNPHRPGLGVPGRLPPFH
ncbi:PREDICTED: proteasome inhibitor PI31 subunit isoform X2 [Dufourea novaeangliae]|uniref:proteasome inhibitor PI31 subunit isoform X2 n=1 Tax=Dufourea novaeangliae TaxID=178035 RepID=UPI000767D284|nr:PREDICTED: proteasome inhibitor PI31 subunit isoform X2 [Dufourea novaeangliae]